MTYTTLQYQIECIQGSWRSWLVSVLHHAVSSLKICGNQMRFSRRPDKRQMSCLSSKREGRRIQGTALWSALPQSLKVMEDAFLEAISRVANHALPAWLSSVVRWVDDGRAIDTIFFDYSRAFDTVPCCILLIKLGRYGLDSGLLAWWRTGSTACLRQ